MRHEIRVLEEAIARDQEALDRYRELSEVWRRAYYQTAGPSTPSGAPLIEYLNCDPAGSCYHTTPRDNSGTTFAGPDGVVYQWTISDTCGTYVPMPLVDFLKSIPDPTEDGECDCGGPAGHVPGGIRCRK